MFRRRREGAQENRVLSPAELAALEAELGDEDADVDVEGDVIADDLEGFDDDRAEAANPAGAAVAADDGGPWDSGDPDRPSAAPEGWLEADLGSLVLRFPPDAEVRVDVDQESGAVVTVGVVRGDDALQVMAFAGPRSSGIWDEVRSEISAGVTGSGGTVDEVEGPHGPELRAVVASDQGQRVPVRFMGIDGPRWFLRAVLTGSGAHDDDAAEPMLAILRQVTVVRDGEARPQRELLPIVLPAAAEEVGPGVPAAPVAEDRPTIRLPERGPEITEIR